jgi:hypothetical protein
MPSCQRGGCAQARVSARAEAYGYRVARWAVRARVGPRVEVEGVGRWAL